MIRPLGDNILVEVMPPKQEGSIVLVEHHHGERIRYGNVRAVGPRVRDLAPGDHIAFFREHLEFKNGDQVVRTLGALGGENLGMLKVKDVLFVVEGGAKLE